MPKKVTFSKVKQLVTFYEEFTGDRLLYNLTVEESRDLRSVSFADKIDKSQLAVSEEAILLNSVINNNFKRVLGILTGSSFNCELLDTLSISEDGHSLLDITAHNGDFELAKLLVIYGARKFAESLYKLEELHEFIDDLRLFIQAADKINIQKQIAQSEDARPLTLRLSNLRKKHYDQLIEKEYKTLIESRDLKEEEKVIRKGC